MMALALYSPNGTHDAQFIGNYANIYVKDALQRVKGVGDIVSRADDFGMRIWLNPEKLASLNMTPADIICCTGRTKPSDCSRYSWWQPTAQLQQSF